MTQKKTLFKKEDQLEPDYQNFIPEFTFSILKT